MTDTATFTLRRAQRLRLIYLPVAAFGGACMIITLLDRLRVSPMGVGENVAFASLFVSMTLGTVLVVRRGLQLRVEITSTAVVLHEILGSRTVDLDDIVGFELDRSSGYTTPDVRLRLTPTRNRVPRSLPVVALSPGIDGWRWNRRRNWARNMAELAPVIEALNAELARRQTQRAAA